MKKLFGFLVFVVVVVAIFYGLKSFGDYIDEQNEKLNHEVINNILDTYEYSYTGEFNKEFYDNFVESLDKTESYLVMTFYIPYGVPVDSALNNYMFKELTDALVDFQDRVYIGIQESNEFTGIVLGFRQFTGVENNFNFLLSISCNTVGAIPEYFVTQDHIDYVVDVMALGTLDTNVDYTYESYWNKN